VRRVTTTLLAILILYTVQPLAAQDKYERKSISYINALWLATPEARKVENQQVSFMLEAIKKQIEMPRFDYNPLPEVLIRQFVDAANARPTLTVDQIASLMQQELMPSILAILEGAMTERGGELVSEEKRQMFLATKAKELGITLEEIEKVMNSVYIYLPVLTKIKKEQSKKDKNKYTYTVEGGIIWFHVNMAGDEPAVNLKVAKTTLSRGFGSDRFAYESAVENFARNLKVATQEIPEFKLSAAISEVDDGTIAFKLGKKEGLKLDECYYVGEWIQQSNGDLSFDRSGWVRIGRIGDNLKDRTATSSAWAVKKGSWSPGMTVVEHPRLGIDIAFKPGAFYTKITKGRIPIAGGQLDLTEDYETYAPGLDVDAHYNVANVTGVSQLFFLVGGNFAFPATLKFESGLYEILSATPPFIWGFHVGGLKKFYLGQLAISGEAKVGMRFLTVEQNILIVSDKITYTIKNNTVGTQFNLGLEYAVSPDVNIGLFGGYRLFPVSEVWTQEVSGPVDVAVFSWNDEFPDINHSGIAFGIYLHFSPPALPFDPLSLLRGALGE